MRHVFIDPLEVIRHQLILLHSQPRNREELEAVYPQVWNEEQLAEDFEVLGFRGDVVDVRKKADGQPGQLSFQDTPWFYFGFIPRLEADQTTE